MNALAYLKYPAWTAWQYVASPRRAVRNTGLALLIFWRVLYLGFFHKNTYGDRGVINVLTRHADTSRGKSVARQLRFWSVSRRGRYIWRVAQKFLARWSLEKLGVHLVHFGLERIDWSRPHIVVANHQSVLDTLLMIALVPNGRFVAKKEALSIPILGRAVRFGGQIVVDRKNHEQAMRAVREGMKNWSNSNIIFFAEGTRTRDGKLQKFKRGAFVMARDTGIPILPVAISGSFEALPKGSLLCFKREPHIAVMFGSEILVSPKALVDDIMHETRHKIRHLLCRAEREGFRLAS